MKILFFMGRAEGFYGIGGCVTCFIPALKAGHLYGWQFGQLLTTRRLKINEDDIHPLCIYIVCCK